ncbi:MAG TPA: hypothetical protein VMD74_02105 [Candidatus Methylomirabilis sp.]|nr:hypothetical protein [Candidatus Methylomirabilis sp.]
MKTILKICILIAAFMFAFAFIVGNLFYGFFCYSKTDYFYTESGYCNSIDRSAGYFLSPLKNSLENNVNGLKKTFAGWIGRLDKKYLEPR